MVLTNDDLKLEAFGKGIRCCVCELWDLSKSQKVPILEDPLLSAWASTLVDAE
jgi:hypothetical protein